MMFTRSHDPPPLPPCRPFANAVQRFLAGPGSSPGGMLVHDIASSRGEVYSVAPAASGGGAVSGGASGGASTGASSGMQIVAVDPAFTDIPCPTIFLGGLPAPIPAGRPTIDADALLRQLQQGQLPSDGLPEGDREAWRAASQITDPISAYNICQAQQLGGKRVLLTERGVAESLARGTIQMAAVPGSTSSTGSSAPGGSSFLPNPLTLLQQLIEARQLSQRVQSRAATLAGAPAPKRGSGREDGQLGAVQGQAAGQPPASGEAVAGSLETAPENGGRVQYCLQDLPARRLLAGGSPPQLAWVPLRVALQLLCELPQHFVLLQSGAAAIAAPQPPPHMQHAADGQGMDVQQRQQQQGQAGGGIEGRPAGSGSMPSGTFDARTSPGDLAVWVVPGLYVRQTTPEGSSVEFTPAFIAHSSAQALWREMREISGGALLMYRRLERSLARRRLEAAAAIIAGGGLRGPAASSGAQDDEEGGPEEPPEISQFIQELGGQLAQEGGALGAAGLGGGLQPPSGLLPRAVAMFACGVVSLAAQGLSWAGNTADWLLMATPLGPRLLGVPETSLQQYKLSDLVADVEQYNQEQAVLQSMISCIGKLGDLATEERQQQAPQAQHRAAAPTQASAASGADASASTDTSQAQAAQPTSLAAALAESSPPDGPSLSTAEVQRRRTALAAAEADSVLRYRRRLAAAALWVALTAKNVAEDSAMGHASLGRLLAKAFLQQGAALSGAALGGGLGRVQHQVGLPSGAATLGGAAPEQPASMQEAVEQVLAAGLPVLEHNGFQHLFTSTDGSSSGGNGRNGGGFSGKKSADGASSQLAPSADGGSHTSGAAAALAAAVAPHCTPDTHLGLGAFVKDATSGAYRVLSFNPLAPPAMGRGLMLVGDLDLAPRQRGRTAGRTSARWLTVGLDDGRKLVK